MSHATSSRWIDIPSFDGQTFAAYLALPPQGPSSTSPRNDPAPGIVVLQEIWGVNAHIQSVADQYASDGYVVLAPDLFWRMKPRVDLGYDEAGTKEAFGYRKAIDLELADRDIAATVAVLRGMNEVAGGVGAVGYCMGGMLAYRAAAKAGIDCAVCYYGGGIAQMLDLAPSITVPMAMHFGDRDAHITPDLVASIKAAVGDRPNVRIDTYAAADHGFNCWARASYHQQSAALAHGRSLAFFATHLGTAG
jgi:carboxymethylenebutenolidase